MRVEDLLVGFRAGLLAGFVVAVVFFVSDMVRVTPLSTPLALSRAISLPLGLPLFTLVHFLAFGCIGIAARAVFRFTPVPASIATGALFGALACSLVFLGAFRTGALVADVPTEGGLPELWAVVVVNALAGAVMGGFLHLQDLRSAPKSGPQES